MVEGEVGAAEMVLKVVSDPSERPNSTVRIMLRRGDVARG
jgi:hypothetical protein